MTSKEVRQDLLASITNALNYIGATRPSPERRKVYSDLVRALRTVDDLTRESANQSALNQNHPARLERVEQAYRRNVANL